MNPQTPPTNPAPPQYVPPAPNPAGPPTGQQYPGSPQHGYERERKKGVHAMVVLQPGEQIVATIKRHPFGIVSMYFAVLLGIGVVGVLTYFMMPDLLSQIGSDSAANLAAGILGCILLLVLLVLGVATTVYWQNAWVVTTDSVTQITQHSLFGRQVSQLSMDNLEDVTVDQHGLIPHMFNFGTLKVQSAGERSKFSFPYCPNPNGYARKILEVHEHFMEERRDISRHHGFASITTTEHGGHSQYPPQQPQPPQSGF